ncbi:MAG: SpoIID/LytB domain-containing protein [Bacillota bacterium]
MGKYGKVVICVILAFFFCIISLNNGRAPSFGANGEESPKIRVALSGTSSVAKITIDVGTYSIVDESTGIILADAQQGSTWTITKKGPSMQLESNISSNNSGVYKGPIGFIAKSQASLNVITYGNVKYRDNVRIINESNNLLVLNELGVEKYLLGVIGPEMGSAAEMEALKAQAVVSRSYALSFVDQSKKYDVTADVNSQVYGGYSAEILPGGQRVAEAVQATCGEVIYYENILVRAFFHANSGGHTANSEDVWSSPLPYLRATPSPFDEYAMSYAVQTSGWPANTFKWERSFSLDQVKTILNDWNNNNANRRINIGQLIDVFYGKYDYEASMPSTCERITELRLVGNVGSGSLFKEEIRKAFGLRSTKFELKMDSTVYVKNDQGTLIQINVGDNLKAVTAGGAIQELNSKLNYYVVKNTFYTQQIPKKLSELTFDGYGFGHGVGMSQWGARGMAALGYTYREIIEYYYNQGKCDGKLLITRLY